MSARPIPLRIINGVLIVMMLLAAGTIGWLAREIIQDRRDLAACQRNGAGTAWDSTGTTIVCQRMIQPAVYQTFPIPQSP